MAEKNLTVLEKLAQIQTTLKAPKGQFNGFGKYKYRSCEDILEALKPILAGAAVTLSDDVVSVGDRVYIKATATLLFNGESISVTGFARESLAKKGMDDSQITGTASSYSRKYALNGLFCIDDTKDADTMDNTPPVDSGYAGDVVADIQSMNTRPELETLWKKLNQSQQEKYMADFTARINELS